MITARDASNAIYGAWRLAHFDPGGAKFFDDTAESCWRSFIAAIVALPAYIVLIALRLAESQPGVGTGTALTVEIIAYFAGWFAYPLAMFHLAPLFNRSRSYFRYMAAYNWSSVLQVVLMVVVTAIVSSGLLPRAFASLMLLATTGIIFAFQWFIARAAFGATVGGAIGMVLLDLALSMLVDGYANRLLRLVPDQG